MDFTQLTADKGLQFIKSPAMSMFQSHTGLTVHVGVEYPQFGLNVYHR